MIEFFFLSAAHRHECPEELVSDKLIHFDEIIPISAKAHYKVDEVKEAIRNVLDKHALKRLEEESSETAQENKTNKLRSGWK